MPGPWDADAATYFGENTEAIAAFDRYMTEKQQPYVTQLEEGSKDARELWTDLNADPEAALRDLVSSVYVNNPDIVSAYNGLFETPETPTAAETPPPVADTPATPALSDEDRALIDWARTKRDAELVDKNAADYAAYKNTLKAEHSLTDDDVVLLDPFIATAPDGAAAVAAYRNWQAKAGIKPVEPTPVADPPPVLGDSAVVAATPPLATQYTRYDQVGDAFAAYRARQAAASDPPPIVG